MPSELSPSNIEKDVTNIKKLDLNQLEVGYRFPISSFQLDAQMIATYLKAVEDTNSNLYRDTKIIPPMAIAAYAMTTMSQHIILPPGTIHVSQELCFQCIVSSGDIFTSYTKVSRRQNRRELRLLSVDLDIYNQSQQEVLSGKSTFILPKQSIEE